MLIFMLLFQANFLFGMNDDQFFSHEELFDEKDFFDGVWNNDFFSTAKQLDDLPKQENPIAAYDDEERVLEEKTIAQARKEHSDDSNDIEDAEEQPQENKVSKTRRPSRYSRPKIKCNYPECSLVVTKNRFKDHLMRAHSKCPWCYFNGDNREELIEHLQEVTSVKDINHDEAAYFCFSCKKFVTTYLSDFKKHSCNKPK